VSGKRCARLAPRASQYRYADEPLDYTGSGGNHQNGSRCRSLARRIGDLDLQRAPGQCIAIELSDRLVGRLERGHLDEPEAARLARVTIGHDGGAVDAVNLV